MNQLQLPVDVHFVVEDDGRSTLLIGGYAMPFPAAKLPEVLSSSQLKQGRTRIHSKPTKPKVKKGHSTKERKSSEWVSNIAIALRKRSAERIKKGLCLRCDNKPKEGMKLCSKCIEKTSKAVIAARKAAA